MYNVQEVRIEIMMCNVIFENSGRKNLFAVKSLLYMYMYTCIVQLDHKTLILGLEQNRVPLPLHTLDGPRGGEPPKPSSEQV